VSLPVSRPSGRSIEGPELTVTYFTDPLCVWSWAFEPVWRRLLQAYEGRIRWRYAMGGMIPSWRDYRDPLNHVERPVHMGAFFRQAAEIGGVPIADRIWVDDPPSSSYPSCVAVKAAELQSLEAGDLYLQRVREALMAQGRNVARRQVLLDVATELGGDRPDAFSAIRFERDLDSAAAREAFRSDLNAARDAGIGRFPTLTLRAPGGEARMIVGYRPHDALLVAVRHVAPSLAATMGSSSPNPSR
jgi:putative protein-disulfide isomerase